MIILLIKKIMEHNYFNSFFLKTELFRIFFIEFGRSFQSWHHQNSLARVITNTSKYQHITPTLKKLHWLPIKQRIDYKLCLLTYKTLTNQQPTYLYNSLSFPSHCLYKIFWFTRSFHSICQIITRQKGFLCHRSTTLEFTTSWYPKFIFFTNIPFQAQTHLFKIAFPP